MRWLMLILVIPNLAQAQFITFQLETDSIPVVMEGWRPFAPWAGGVNKSSPDLVDIDSDGDLDFFQGEISGKVEYFTNSGTFQLPHFTFIAGQYDSLHSVQGEGYASPDFYDGDGDDDLDAFVGSGHVIFIKNIGSLTQPYFASPRDTILDTSGNPVFGTNIALMDIDADGDKDLIAGEYQGYLQLYRNIGTPDSFVFLLENNFWLNFDLGAWADPCFVDIDADGDYDLFIGERYGKLWYYRNDGTPQQYNFTLVSNNWLGIDGGDYSSPEFADIDGDGDYDLFVGRESNSSSLIGDVFYYENIGTPQTPQFQFVTKNYLMIDIAQLVRPQLVDINADGGKELIAGTGNYLDYFANVGDSIHPEFVFMPGGFQGINLVDIAPFFVDIDADGDYDLITGTSSFGTPSIGLYLNHGTPRNPNFQLFNAQFVTNPNFFVWLLPVLVDIDGDGDYDLFIFDINGHFYYYQNTGTSQWPTFTYMTNQWQGINLGTDWHGFFFADLDNDLDLDLVVENPFGSNFYFYRNIGWVQSPQMVLETTTLLPDSNSVYTPYLTDIDDDGDCDLFVGHGNGGMLFYRNVTGESPVPPGPKRPAPIERMISVLPNPGNSGTTISYVLSHPQHVNLSVYNLLGSRLVTLVDGLQAPGSHVTSWDATWKASGIYLVRFTSPEWNATQKVVIVK